MAPPFSLTVGQSVYVSVVAYNEVGDSQSSIVGNGAKVLVSTVPDEPLNIRRDESEVYSETKLALTWDAPGFNGN